MHLHGWAVWVFDVGSPAGIAFREGLHLESRFARGICPNPVWRASRNVIPADCGANSARIPFREGNLPKPYLASLVKRISGRPALLGVVHAVREGRRATRDYVETFT